MDVSSLGNFYRDENAYYIPVLVWKCNKMFYFIIPLKKISFDIQISKKVTAAFILRLCVTET